MPFPPAFAKADVSAAGAGHHRQDDHDRRHLPADRAGVELRADPAGDEGVLQLHQRAARPGREARRHGRQIVFKYYDDGYNPVNSVQLQRKLVAAGQGLRGRRHARHRGQPGRAAVPELVEGAARARLDRARASSARTTRSTRGRSAGSPTTSPRAASTGPTSARTSRTRRSRSCTRTTATARTTSTASRPRSAPRRCRRQIVGEEAFDVHGGGTPQSQLVAAPRVRRRHADDLRDADGRRCRRTRSSARSAGSRRTSTSTPSRRPTRSWTTAVAASSADTVNGSISASYLKDPASPRVRERRDGQAVQGADGEVQPERARRPTG